MKHPFRFKKRNGIYYCIFAKNPTHPVSTGKTTKAEAVEWALLVIDTIQPSGDTTFGKFAEGFFDENSSYIKRTRARNKIIGTARLYKVSGVLRNYLLPRWESTKLIDIKARSLDDWILSLSIGFATKNDLLSTMRAILDDALEQELIEYNPARRLKPYHGKTKEVKIFTPEELKILFPSAEEHYLKIWLTQEWYTFFILLATCGLRPGEAKALQWRDWHKEDHGLIISKAVENCTGKVKNTKTGIVKPAVLTTQTETALITLNAQAKPQLQDFIFPTAKRWTETTGKHLKYSLIRAGVAVDERTPYSFRHTFNTLTLARLPSGTVRVLMGHKTEAMSSHYNHPTETSLLGQVNGVRDILEEIF